MAKEKAAAEENAKRLSGVVVQISARAGQGGRLFGAVTSQEIAEALREQHGIEIEKNKIVQAEPIKQFGSYEVKAKLGYEVSGTINVLVTEKNKLGRPRRWMSCWGGVRRIPRRPSRRSWAPCS